MPPTALSLGNKNSPRDRAEIQGEVSTVNPSSASISFGFGPTDPNHDVDSFQSDQPTVPPPNVDIEAIINSKRTRVGAVSISGVNPTLAPGDNFHEGDLEIQGDLVLDSSNLYVSGNLKVNGSIKGNGQVFVSEETRFFGDAELVTDSQDSISLYSKGHVHLSGFNGTEFMNATYPAGTEDGDRWRELVRTLDIVKREVDSRSDMPVNDARISRTGSGLTFGTYQDAIAIKLVDRGTFGKGATQEEAQDWVRTNAPELEGNGDFGIMHKLRDSMESRASISPTQEFMNQKLEYLDKLYGRERSGNGFSDDYPTYSVINLAMDSAGGHFQPPDPVPPAEEHWTQVVNSSRSASYDRPGAAYFKGLVYTNGAFVADSEINIVGALVAHDDGSQESFRPDGYTDTFEPGDVILNSNTHLTFVEEMFDPEQDSQAIGNLNILTWLE